MKAVIVSRYPRVDTPAWKREVAEGLLAAGIDVAVLYSRSSVTDQARAGLREFGVAGVREKFASLRARGRDSSTQGGDASLRQSLADWARGRALDVAFCARLGDPDCLVWLRAAQPDLLVLAGADIVPPSTLEIPRIGSINPHSGMLPAYRGMNVTEWSVLHDDPVGVTVHMVDPGIDTGDILLREAIRVARGDTLQTIRAKQQQMAADLLVAAAHRIADGTVDASPQRPEDGRQYYRMHPALRALVELKLADGSYACMAPVAPVSPDAVPGV
jgi:hypothetical protein